MYVSSRSTIMAYTDPHLVMSPRASVSNLFPIYDGGEGEFSVALLDWDGGASLGIRWNGSDKEDRVGNPQSRGLSTWFVVPGLLMAGVLQSMLERGLVGGGQIKDKAKAEQAIRQALLVQGVQ